MKKRSLAMVLSVLMALGFMAHAPAARAATWEQDNKLTLELPSDYEADLAPEPEAGGDPAPDPGEEPAEPADPVGVVVDLYLVAAAQPWAGYDAYTYTKLEDAFSSLKLPELDTVTTEEWQAFTWEASELVLKAAQSGAAIVPTVTGAELGELEEPLASGLYLLIPHGKGMEPEQYITSLRLDGAEHPATLANSADYTYTFQPQLVSLPEQGLSPVEGETDPEAPGVFNGSWEHAVTVFLKPDQQPRFGKLTITKGIDYYEEAEPATFVFEVTATKDINADGEAEEVYRNTVALTFSKGGSGSESITLDRVPVGSHVTVREVYSGAFYTAADDMQEGDLTVDLAEGLKLAFENTHGPDQKRGHGIINQFSFDDEEGWTHKAVDPNAAEPAPEA